MTIADFDLAIIGGGIIGAGIARDAALRGMRTLLLEKNDFGSGTTAGSTRLIHGGLRYLEMLDFRLVRMDLRERETLLRIAPHLVKPLEFHLPYLGSSWFYRTKMQMGLLLYDLLSYDKSLPNRSYLRPDEVRRREPALRAEALQGASTFSDAQVNMPERLCLENVLDAAAHGAEIWNGAEVTGAVRKGGILAGLEVRMDSGESRTIRARVTVNAGGPWFDEVAGRVEPAARTRIRTTKGIHLACRPLNRQPWVLFSPIDGRLFFAIPWMGLTWLGTTDTDYQGNPGLAAATPEDVQYVLRSTEHYFPQIRQHPVCFTNAGVRALVMQKGHESSVSRSHQLVDGARSGIPGLLSVLGGKITGYRAIAEETTDAAARLLGNRKPCHTARAPLPGAAATPAEDWLREASALGIPASSATALAAFYGSRVSALAALCRETPALARPLHPDYPEIAAQVRLAVRDEYCRHLDDFLVRRTGLAFTPDQGQRAAEPALRQLAAECQWDTPRQQAEWDRWQQYLARTRPDGVESRL